MTIQNRLVNLKNKAASSLSASEPMKIAAKCILSIPSFSRALFSLRGSAKILICLLAAQLIVAHSASAQQAPAVDWQRTDWYPTLPWGPSQSQAQSGEDWWYDHKNSYVVPTSSNPIPNGHICAGFSSYANLLLGDESGSGGCNQPSWDPHSPFCEDFEDGTHRRGTIQATLALIPPNGGPATWFKMYNDGTFYRVIQTSDGGYLAVGHTAATRTGGSTGAPFLYNPNQSAGQVTDQFGVNMGCQQPGENRGHMMLVKTDSSGNVQWQYLYGMQAYRDSNGNPDPVSAYKSDADPSGLIETDSGNIRIVGNAPDPNAPQYPCGGQQILRRAFMMEVNGQTGYWNWGAFYGPTTAPSNFAAITKYGTGSNLKYAVSGTEMQPHGSPNAYTGCDLWQEAYVILFDSTGPPPTQIWKKGGFPNSQATFSQRTDDIQISTSGNILFPIIIDCQGCLYSGYNSGEAQVYRLDPNNNGNILGVSNLAQVTAYDLKLRIHPTADGGFAAVSSKRINPAPAPYSCYDTRYWNTDAYVAKYNSCGNVEWEKTFDVDNLPAAAAYPGNVKKQECVYSISQGQDGGFVVSGNNSFNFDDSYLAKLLPALPPTSGLWIADTPPPNQTLQQGDIGLEPNPDNGPMWVSEDIWVRNQNDGLVNTTHQNPIGLQQNFVYVRVRNKGCQAELNGTLQVYWAKASTGLSWPLNWNGYSIAIPPTGCTPNTLWGDRVTPNPIAIGTVAPNSETIIAIPWTPPNPNDYACDGADQGHICLLARIETSTTSPFDMTFPEISSVFSNVKSNNKIAWKNVTVVDLYPSQKQKAWSVVRNATGTSTNTKLSFELPKTEIENSFYKYGVVEVGLGKALIKKWVNGGMAGGGIRRIDKRTIRILGPNAWIGNIQLDRNEMHPVSLLFRVRTRPPKRGKNTFTLDLVQTDADAASKRAGFSNRGGVRFTINTRKNAPKGSNTVRAE